MIAKLLDRSEGCIIVEYSAESPVEAMILGLVAVTQVPQQTFLSSNSTPSYGLEKTAPKCTVGIGGITLQTVSIVQAKETP